MNVTSASLYYDIKFEDVSHLWSVPSGARFGLEEAVPKAYQIKYTKT